MNRSFFFKTLVAACVSVLGTLGSSAALAQATDFPSKPVKFVVPFPPGSGTDTSARYFA